MMINHFLKDILHTIGRNSIFIAAHRRVSDDR